VKSVLFPISSSVTLETVEGVHPTAPIVVCDFYVEKVEEGQDVAGGYQLGRVLNIDHHAPTVRMARFVSSTNLAIERINHAGLPSAESMIIINHTDCDSVLSSGIMSGRLQPDDDLGVAAISADHTGEENSIADMLQGIQHHRDLELSLRNVELMRSGHPLEKIAEDGLTERKRRRDKAAQCAGLFSSEGNFFYANLKEDTDTEFFPELLPDAALILISVPNSHNRARSIMKFRLGKAAPEGASIQSLKLEEFDQEYGGRWNAGANKRNTNKQLAGTEMSFDIYLNFRSCIKHITSCNY